MEYVGLIALFILGILMFIKPDGCGNWSICFLSKGENLRIFTFP